MANPLNPTDITSAIANLVGGGDLLGEGNLLQSDSEPEPEQTVAQIESKEKKDGKNAQYELSKEEKGKISEYIIKLVDDAEQARGAWMQTRKECVDLVEGKREPKSDPWPNCSNISVMAASMHAKLMHAKLFPAVWNENLIYWRGNSIDDKDNVDKVRRFMNWLIRRELHLADFMDDMLNDVIVNGTVALKLRWVTEYKNVKDGDNPGKYKRIAHQKVAIDNISIDDIYLPYVWEGDVDKAEFIAQNVYQRISDIKGLNDRKIYNIAAEDLKAIEDRIDDVLPDTLTKKKATNEGTEEYFAHKASYPVRLIECYLKWEIDGQEVDSIFVIDYNTRKYVSGKPLTAVSPIGLRPWIIGAFMRRTNRPYGIGLVEAMKGLAEELDAIHNQRIDAGTISIAPFFFYRAASSVKPEEVHIGPGVGVPVDDINDVKLAQFPGNFVASYQEEKIVIEYIEKLTSTSAYQQGRESDIVKSRATATGTMAIIAQGEQAYTILGLRVQRIASALMTKILQFYQSFIPPGFASRIIGEEEEGELLFPGGLTPEAIIGGYDCYMLLDSTAGNRQQERQINGALLEQAPNLFALAQDPRGYDIASDFLISVGKIDVEKYLGPKPKENKLGQAPIPIGGGTGQIGGGQPQGGVA